MWFDNLRGASVNEHTARDLARWVGGTVMESVQEDMSTKLYVVIPTQRGDIIARDGDIIAQNQSGAFRVVRVQHVKTSELANETPRQNHPNKPKPKPSDLSKKK